MNERAVVIVDGEHYPPVTQDGIDAVRARGFDVVAAVFAGGHEKLAGPLELGELPIVRGSNALVEAIKTYEPAVVFDLSDDPVVDHETRMRLASIAIAHGVSYEGPGYRFEPPPMPRVASVPTIAVIGTAKRCGKTAVSAHVARTLKGLGATPVIVAMGRGGPASPSALTHPPTVDELVALAERGEHAASDVYEDAIVADVSVIGARRAGAGIWGEPGTSTVPNAVREACRLTPDVVILEGSGTAIPPVAADVTILIARASDLVRPVGTHRILLADLCVVTMHPVDSTRTNSALTSPDREQAQGVSRVAVDFHPTPVGSVEGKTVYVATTAPNAAGQALRERFEHVHGAVVVGMSHHLADRARLAEDLTVARGTYEVLACELKAAAVDVAVREARATGAEVVFVDNRPTSIEGDLEAEIDRLYHLARERFELTKTS